MLPDVHRALERLLLDHGGIPAAEVDVKFEAPTREWIDSLTRPTINLFLHHLQENAELRHTQFATSRANGKGTSQLPPRRIDLHYMISAITTELDDEHRLLWRALATLMRYPYFPPQTLAAELADLEPPLVGQIKPAERGPSPLDVWTALGSPPRPTLEYVLTAPLDLAVSVEVPLVLTGTTRYRRIGPESILETRTLIGGVVRGAGGEPVQGVVVAIEGSAVTGVTDRDGRYSLARVSQGRITLSAARGDLPPTAVSFDVPADSYDIDLD